MNMVSSSKTNTRKMVNLALMAAMAFVVVAVGRVPVVSFLKYEPKDVVIVISGFIYGPMAALAVSFVVCFVEMVTISTTGPIGFIMNLLSSAGFACTAAYFYKRDRSVRGAIIGLVAGSICMTGTMLLWNYFITPYYMKVSREDVAAMLIPIFLPFNLFKSGLNAVFTLLLYKPLVTALRRAHLIPESDTESTDHKPRVNVGALLFAGTVILSCVLLFLSMKKII